MLAQIVFQRHTVRREATSLKNMRGHYLGHDYDARYEVNSENPDVVFHVCGDAGNCASKTNSLVPVTGTWFMQDQMGVPPGTCFGWLGGGDDQSAQGNSTTALVVTGSAACYGGKCAIRISFPPGGGHAPCPLGPGQSHLGVSMNPNSCQPFYWQEVARHTEK
ncbi:hypothetical protein DL771_007986 [Monosporascus sp. 5C6A]|nr:hypothetical protein DL771_007986 [Monosporascus sp. 5C6A]